MKKLVILESPYAGNVEDNVKYARECLKDSLQRGEAPIASHLLYTQPNVLDDTKPEERELGIDAGLAWGRVAEATVVYVDKGVSNGMIQGIKKAVLENRFIIVRKLYVSEVFNKTILEEYINILIIQKENTYVSDQDNKYKNQRIIELEIDLDLEKKNSLRLEQENEDLKNYINKADL